METTFPWPKLRTLAMSRKPTMTFQQLGLLTCCLPWESDPQQKRGHQNSKESNVVFNVYLERNSTAQHQEKCFKRIWTYIISSNQFHQNSKSSNSQISGVSLNPWKRCIVNHRGWKYGQGSSPERRAAWEMIGWPRWKKKQNILKPNSCSSNDR